MIVATLLHFPTMICRSYDLICSFNIYFTFLFLSKYEIHITQESIVTAIATATTTTIAMNHFTSMNHEIMFFRSSLLLFLQKVCLTQRFFSSFTISARLYVLFIHLLAPFFTTQVAIS